MPIQWRDLGYAYLPADAGHHSPTWMVRERGCVLTTDDQVDQHEPPPVDADWVEILSARTWGLTQEQVHEWRGLADPRSLTPPGKYPRTRTPGVASDGRWYAMGTRTFVQSISIGRDGALS